MVSLADLLGLGGGRIVTGLDIGSSGVKVIQLKKGKEGPILTNFGIAYYPEAQSAMASGNVEEVDVQLIADTIKQALENAGIKKTGQVVASISAANAIIRFIEVPQMTDEELAANIRFQAENILPFSLEEMALSYFKIGQKEKEGGTVVLKVLIAAVDNQKVMTYLDILQKAGIKDPILDIDSIAAMNAFIRSIQDDATYAIVDMGASKTAVTILSERQIRFTRTIAYGGSSITSALQNVLGIEWHEAENAKKTQGKIVIDDEEEDEIAETVRQMVEDLVGELRRSLDFYRAQPEGGPVEAIILTGGSCKLENIDTFLNLELGVDVMIGNPLEGIQLQIASQEEFEAILPELSVAFGLAIREVVE